jgi:hypothetical protein
MRHEFIFKKVFFIINPAYKYLFAHYEMSVCFRFFLVVFKGYSVIYVLIIAITGDLHVRYIF